MKNTPPINNLFASASAAAGLSIEGNVNLLAPQDSRTNAAGTFRRGFGYDRPDRTPERIAKAQAFHARVLALRQDKTRCPRCGKPRGEKFRTCDRCRVRIKKAKLRSKGYAVMKDGEFSIADLAGMVIQVRREMNRMQERFKQWQKAAQYRQTLKLRTNTMRKKYLKTFSQAEALEYLAQTNHAYEAKQI